LSVEQAGLIAQSGGLCRAGTAPSEVPVGV